LGPGPWVIVSPHDDDAILGAGATLAAARAEGIDVHVVVVTDGRMGWNDPREKEHLVSVREGELRRAFGMLGIRDSALHLLNFADGSLHLERGCRPDERGAGVGRALTRVFRATLARAVFCCTHADIHPDHRVTAEETEIAATWASGAIWQELGAPLGDVKQWAYAVYCEFPQAPEVQVITDPVHHRAKINALRCFESQPFINSMTARLEEDGPVEYFANVGLPPYRPKRYATLFTNT